jgi:hypothetical protein
MSKNKFGINVFTAPHKYILKSTEGKTKKSLAHRYERRRIREFLRHPDEMMEDFAF